MDWKTQAVKQLTRQGAELARRAQKSEVLRHGAAAAAAAPLPIKFIAQRCAASGLAGAIFEGGQGASAAYKAMGEGRIDQRQAAIHTAAEAGCGFVTSSAGVAAALGAMMIGLSEIPMILVASGASVGVRHAYKTIVGETLPSEGGGSDSAPPSDGGDSASGVTFEHIGPPIG